jgi:non-ribosomal peptide synthetase component F
MTYVSVLDQFEKSAAQCPSNTALSLENGDRFSYFEIDQLSTKVKDVLTTNVAPKLISENDLSEPTTPLIGIMMDRGVSFIVSMLGTLKAGCAYVPIDPTFPPDRQIHIFSHSRCEYLIVDEVSYEAAQSLGVTLPQLLRMDSNGKIILESDIISSYSSISPLISNEYAAIDKNNNNGLAYVLYTSGSTGKPKGVMVKHVGVYNIINWFANKLNIGPNSRVMGLTTFCFDISVLEMFLPLTRGGELVLAKSATQKDPFTLLSLIESRKVSVFQATPTTYEMMLATGWKGDPNVDFLVVMFLCSLFQ